MIILDLAIYKLHAIVLNRIVIDFSGKDLQRAKTTSPLVVCKV